MTRADRRTLVRQLSQEGLSARQIAGRLGVGKDTVRRDLEAIERQDAQEAAPDAAPNAPDAPQVIDGAPAEAAPQDAPPAEDECASEPGKRAPGAPVAQLPRRVSAERLDFDLRRWPGARRALAELGSTGLDHEELIDFAVRVVAMGYRQGLADGAIEPGRFLVLGMRVGPYVSGPPVPRRPAAAAPEGA